MTISERVRTPAVAWAIHLFTASGVLFGLLGLLAVLDGSPRAALLWLIVAIVVDGVDGPMARAAAVNLHVPTVDGNILDLVIDYVTCVVAPAVFVHQFDLLPRWFSLPGTGLIMLTSLYVFSRSDLMTKDHYFNGFPAMWNLVVNSMFVLQIRPVINVVVIVSLCLLTFMPVKFAHPIRVCKSRFITVPITVGWLGSMAYLTATYPKLPLWGESLQWLGIGYVFWLAIERTFFRREADVEASVVAPA